MITIENLFSKENFFKQFSEEDLFRFKFEIPPDVYSFWFENDREYFEPDCYTQLTQSPDKKFRNTKLNGIRWVLVGIPKGSYRDVKYLLTERWFTTLENNEYQRLIITKKLEIPYYRIRVTP